MTDQRLFDKARAMADAGGYAVLTDDQLRCVISYVGCELAEADITSMMKYTGEQIMSTCSGELYGITQIGDLWIDAVVAQLEECKRESANHG